MKREPTRVQRMARHVRRGSTDDPLRSAQRVTALAAPRGPGSGLRDGFVSMARVRQGEDSYGCGDCGAYPGQYHVPGCDLERCPSCGGQLITCERRGCGFTAYAGFVTREGR